MAKRARRSWVGWALLVVIVCGYGASFLLDDVLHAEATDQNPPRRARPGRAPRPYAPSFPGSDEHVYKTINGTELRLWVFKPSPDAAPTPRPAIVFFFGGGWRGGHPGQFLSHARYLVSRGMVAALVDYRVASRHGVTPLECVQDGKSAVRWLRAHASDLGIDPHRIAAAGSSAGGHVAACTALIGEFDEPDEDASISSKPDALVLFDPVLSIQAVGVDAGRESMRDLAMTERLGFDPARLSPYHQIRPGLPPTLLMFGDRDPLAAVAVEYDTAASAAGNRCELALFPDQMHGFYSRWNRTQTGAVGALAREGFTESLRAADGFLVSLGFLEGEPTIDAYADRLEAAASVTPAPRPSGP